MSSSDKAGCAVGILVLIIGALVVFFLIKHAQYREAKVEPFKDHLSEYVSSEALKHMEGGQAHLKGKIVVIDKKEKKVDDMYFDLPEGLCAAKHEEVGTIVWLERGERMIGKYTDGAGGYVKTCQVTIVDKSRNAIIEEREFAGSDPPGSKRGSAAAYGSDPDGLVKDFLIGLPRKSAGQDSARKSIKQTVRGFELWEELKTLQI